MVLQCTGCYGRYQPFTRILKSSVDVPIWLIASTVTNTEYYFEESDRLLLQNMFSSPDNNEKPFEELLLRYAMRDKKQRFAFHACHSCIRKTSKMATLESKALTSGEYALVRLAGLF